MGIKFDFAETISWIRQFINVNIVFGVLAVVLRYYYNSLLLGVIIGILGIVLGIVYAEWIRKKFGNSRYYDSLYHTKVKKEGNNLKK